MRTLLREQIDGSLLRFAVDAHIGDGVEPDLCCRVDRTEVGQLEPVQEILFDVADTRLHAPLLVAAGDIASLDRKAVVAGKVEIARIEHRCGAGQALQNRRFKIVDHDFGRHAAHGREGMFVAGEEMLHGLGDGEFHEHLAAKRQHHDEEREPATGIAHRDGPLGTPVDLRAFARQRSAASDRPAAWEAGCGGRNPAGSSRQRGILPRADAGRSAERYRGGCPAAA